MICVHYSAAVRIFSQWRKLRIEEPFGPIGHMRAHGCQSGIFVVRVGMGSCFQCVMTYDDAAVFDRERESRTVLQV